MRLWTERSGQYLAAKRDYVIQGHDSRLIHTHCNNLLRCGDERDAVSAKLLPCAHLQASPKQHEHINMGHDSWSTAYIYIYHWRREQRKFIAQNSGLHHVMLNIHSTHNTLAQLTSTWERNCRKMVITRMYTIPLHCAA